MISMRFPVNISVTVMVFDGFLARSVPLFFLKRSVRLYRSGCSRWLRNDSISTRIRALFFCIGCSWFSFVGVWMVLR